MTETVVTIVAHRLSIRTGDAETRLRTLSDQWRHTVKENGTITIHGLGTFRRAASGLTFEPDDMLEEAAWLTRSILGPLRVDHVASTDALPEEASTSDDAEALGTLDIYPELEEQHVEPKPPKEEPAATSKAEQAPRPERSRATEWQPSRPMDATPPVKRHARRRPVVWIALIVVLLAVGLTAWLILPSRTDTNPPAMTDILPSGVDDTLIAATDTVFGEDATTGANASTKTEDNVLPEDVDGNTGEETPGEKKGGLDIVAGGYTLIVASFDNFESAASERDRMRALVKDSAIPVDIMLSHDGTKFRVAVGQHPTIAGTLELKVQLPMLPEDAWSLRVHE